VKSGEAVKVLRAKRYFGPAGAVTMVDAQWQLLVDCLYRDQADEDPERWLGFPGIELRGRLQIYLPESEGDASAAQLIAAQLTSDTSIDAMGEGHLLAHRTIPFS
jgi:hypothetical protein